MYDFASVPEREEDRREVDLASLTQFGPASDQQQVTVVFNESVLQKRAREQLLSKYCRITCLLSSCTFSGAYREFLSHDH